MKVTRVQYTVRSDYAEQNRKNIAAVMRELRALDNSDVHYAVYLHGDGKTFMHLAQQNTAEAEKLPTSLESFKRFQAELKENLEISPKVETFGLVDSATPIF
jgi:homoserine kinase